MDLIARTLLPRVAVRALALLTGTLTLLSLSLVALSTPAYAHVEEVSATKTGVTKIKAGLQPRESEYSWYGSRKYNGMGKGESVPNHAVASFDNASGNPVVHTANTYAIYWDPQDYYHGDWQGLIDGFLANIGTAGSQLANVFAVDAQYTDKTNKPAASYPTFHGAYTDTHPYPVTNGCVDPRSFEPFGVPLLEGTTTPVCLTATQVQAELERFLKQHDEEHNSLPRGMGTIFYLLTPPGATVCLNEGGANGHCSDFNGTPIEISRYEEARNRLPEEEEIYGNELIAYDEAMVKYGEEEKAYNEAKVKYNEAVAEYAEAVVAYEEELKTYKENRKKDQEEKKRDTETEPVEPTKPVAPSPPVEPKAPFEPVPPKEPEGYKTYKQSFCSYHDYINPTNAPEGDEKTILYAVIPWTAGGDGDYHLTLPDETAGFACQDSGFEPHEPSKQDPELAAKELEPTETAKARHEFEVESKAVKEPVEVEKEHELPRPVDQEPNQLSGRGPDGSFDTGLADLVINQIAVEQQDIVTDPLLNGWRDSASNEVTDECRNFFAGAAGSAAANENTLAGTLANQTLAGSYYLNSGYSLAGVDNLEQVERKHPGVEYPGLPYPADGPCPSGVALEPKFTAPNTVNGGEVVGFDGMESDISLNSAIGFSATDKPQPNYATYTWNFGDGTPEVSGYAPGAPACETPWLTACAASVFHSYIYGGTYDVTLTVTDVGGHKASVTHPIAVIGPKPPSPAPTPAPSNTTPSGSPSGSGSGSSGSSGGSTPGQTGTTSSVPAPVVTASISSTSLKNVRSSGIAVRYTTNEQVAGSIQVLLESTVAKRLGVHGATATGLPKGTPTSIVVGTAVLVTTKAGHGTIRIKFSSRNAARLKNTHKLKLMLRLFARNASRQSPQTTTSLSTVVLNP